MYFSDDVFENIVTNTKKFVQFSVNQKHLTQPDFVEKYLTDTNLNEMKAYFGLAIMFGVLGQNRYKNYWSSNQFLGNKSVQNVMTLRRYQKLSEYLHISERELEKPDGHPEYDELVKVQWLLNHVLEMFPKYKHPECHQTIEKGMVKFSGRCRFLQ